MAYILSLIKLENLPIGVWARLTTECHCSKTSPVRMRQGDHLTTAIACAGNSAGPLLTEAGEHCRYDML